MAVPVIGRLFWFEYLALFASLILVLLEWVIHFIMFWLRKYAEEAPRSQFHSLQLLFKARSGIRG